jgi:hypothetical protein
MGGDEELRHNGDIRTSQSQGVKRCGCDDNSSDVRQDNSVESESQCRDIRNYDITATLGRVSRKGSSVVDVTIIAATYGKTTQYKVSHNVGMSIYGHQWSQWGRFNFDLTNRNPFSILLNLGTGDQQSEQTKSILLSTEIHPTLNYSILVQATTTHLEIWTSTCQLRILRIPQHSTSVNLAVCSAIQRYGGSLELTPNGPKLQHLVTSTRTWNHQISQVLK